MPSVEVWSGRARDRVVTLTLPAYSIGSDVDAVDILMADSSVSGIHAVLERVGNAWLLRDVGSRNGTWIGGQRLVGQRRLHDRDEAVLGRSRLVFCDSAESRRPRTDALAAPPDNLTRMERRVLVELCRPLVSHNAFQPPASVREIAARLYVGKNAVQAHITNLYDKFGILDEPGVNRRVALANAAVERGSVTVADLEDNTERGGDGA